MHTKTIRILLSLLLTAAILAACAGCGGAGSSAQSGSSKSGSSDSGSVKTGSDIPVNGGAADDPLTETRPEQFNQDEYILYQNIFYQGYAESYDGGTVTKEGVFAEISDAYSNRTRYYVWGYYDQTLCCDWQWEFVPQDGETLPPIGSLVTVTGTFVSDENALDKYWITDAQVETTTGYAGPTAERDMCGMSCTLERVQIYNILYHADVFEGQTFTAYGRIASPDTLEDPYYDNSWQIGFTWNGDVPAIGTLVELTGTIRGGRLVAESMVNR